jgi:hypothetical protein
MYTGFWWEIVRQNENLEDLDVDERIILKLIFKTWHGDMDRVDPAEDRDRWPALVNANEHPRSKKCGKFLY